MINRDGYYGLEGGVYFFPDRLFKPWDVVSVVILGLDKLGLGL